MGRLSYIGYKLKDAKWWFLHRFHPKHRYHFLDLRSKYDDYKAGWLDADHVMELACFGALVRFVEEEEGLKVTKWKPDPNDPDPEDQDMATYYAKMEPVYNEIVEIYKWWTKDRKNEQIAIDRLMGKLYGTEREVLSVEQRESEVARLTELEESFRLNSDTMLKRLIEIRHYLWT